LGVLGGVPKTHPNIWVPKYLGYPKHNLVVPVAMSVVHVAVSVVHVAVSVVPVARMCTAIRRALT